MQETTLASETIYEGKVLGLEVLDVELEPGIRTKREIIRHSEVAAVLAQTPNGKFLFVKQYRKPVEAEIVEIVAGGLENDETPQACAIREMKEETGYDVLTITPLVTIWPTPGYSDEVIHILFAEITERAACSSPDDDERIENLFLDSAQVECMITSEGIVDAKTLIAWRLWTTRNERTEQ